MATRSELDSAYRATTYRLLLPEGALDLRVDVAQPALAAWLRANGIREWAILTAANPASQALPARENAERQAQLECALLEAGYELFVVVNVADDGRWPDEEACFVPHIPAQSVLEMARRFGQNAVLLGSEDSTARLVWTED